MKKKTDEKYVNVDFLANYSDNPKFMEMSNEDLVLNFLTAIRNLTEGHELTNIVCLAVASDGEGNEVFISRTNSHSDIETIGVLEMFKAYSTHRFYLDEEE